MSAVRDVGVTTEERNLFDIKRDCKLSNDAKDSTCAQTYRYYLQR